MGAVVLMLGVVVALQAVLVVGLLRSHAEILRELHELKAESPALERPDRHRRRRPGVADPRGTSTNAEASDLIGVDAAGDAVKVAVRGHGQRTLLIFLSSGCLTCRVFWDALAHPPSLALERSIRPVIVTQGPERESLSAIARLAPAQVQTILSSQAWDDYAVPVAPYAILVNELGLVIGEGAAATWRQLRDLMHQAIDDSRLGSDADLRRRVEDLRRRAGATGDRDAATDEALLAAGIGPDHPSLWGEAGPQDQET